MSEAEDYQKWVFNRVQPMLEADPLPNGWKFRTIGSDAPRVVILKMTAPDRQMAKCYSADIVTYDEICDEDRIDERLKARLDNMRDRLMEFTRR